MPFSEITGLAPRNTPMKVIQNMITFYTEKLAKVQNSITCFFNEAKMTLRGFWQLAECNITCYYILNIKEKQKRSIVSDVEASQKLIS